MINKKFLKADAQMLGWRRFREGGRNAQLSFIIPYFLFLISSLFLPSGVYAQQTFTEHLTRRVAGEGTVTLHQDAEIDALVNTSTSAAASHRPSLTTANPSTDSVSVAASEQLTTGRRTQAVGYRIQVYAGGNNRQSKNEAHYMAGLVRSNFSELPVYTGFISPRWVCRVGDFKTREEATEQLRKMRATQKFGEASIVKSKIFVYY